MDILKIRKKRAKEKKSAAPTSDAPAPAADEATSDEASSARDAAAEAEAEAVAHTPAQAVVSESWSDDEIDDPLREFLARYDDGEGNEGGAAALADEAQTVEARRFLSFELAGEAYAASIMDVREILRVVALTAVPRAPIQILGVVSKRGTVMPVIDLAATLNLRKPDRRYNTTQRVLVVGDGDRVCGLRVDRVLEVVRLSDEDIEEVPASLGARSLHQLRGLGRAGDRMFSLLDVQAVLDALASAAGIEVRGEV